MPNTGEQSLNIIKPGRLKKRPEFLCVAQNGRKWVSDTVIVQALETNRHEIRFGFTATKKIGNAVTRNRAKRRMRAAVDYLMTVEKIKSADISPLKKGCISPTGSRKTPNNSPTPIRI